MPNFLAQIAATAAPWREWIAEVGRRGAQRLTSPMHRLTGWTVSRFNIFQDQHFYAAAITARLAVNAATMTTALIIMEQTVPSQQSYTKIMDDVVVARLLLAIAVGQTLWIFFKLPPAPSFKGFSWGCFGYLILAMAWAYVPISILQITPPWSATLAFLFSCSTVISALGFFAFIANPKSRDGGH